MGKGRASNEYPGKGPPRKWRVIKHVTEIHFTGWLVVDPAGALWCESVEGGVEVFGPGMWVRAQSRDDEEEDNVT